MTLSQTCAMKFVPLMARVILCAAFLPIGWAQTFSETDFSLAQTKQLAAIGVTAAGMDWATIQSTGFSATSTETVAPPPPSVPLHARTLYTIALASNDARFPYPALAAWLVALSQLGGSLLLLVGAFARLSALSLAAVMVGAFVMTSLPELKVTGWWTMPPSDYQRVFTQIGLFALAVNVVLVGGGTLSVDGGLGPQSKQSRGAGDKASSKGNSKNREPM
ncbi:MAG: DoxX family protein [Phycisphaerales bacterium]|nr:DoxX family protein [Phycisphaerales bacterium]